MPVKAGTRFDRYEIISPLGAGGMGEVYLARDTRLNRKVALKILPQAYTHDADRVRRFEQEAKAASALNHPNIVTIYEVGRVDGAHFIATEYIEGQNLRRRLRQGSFGVSEAVEIAMQVVSALHAAHSAGIVHRDIKPENVMLRPDGYVKVLDFGLAKLTEQRKEEGEGERGRGGDISRPLAQSPTPPLDWQTDPGIVLGTAPYMSPEQARAQKTDARSDIFSLGTVLYEMIAGRGPFHDQTPSDALAAVLQRDPAPLTRYPGVPPALAEIARKALAKKPDERYQTAAELLAALKALRHNLPTGPASATASFSTYQSVSNGEADAAPDIANRDTFIEPAARDTQITPVSSAGIVFSEIKKYKRSVVVALLIFIALMAGAGYGIYRWLAGRGDNEASGDVRFTRLAVPGRVLDAALAPDGKYVAYVVEDGERRSLWVKQVAANSNPLQLIAPTEQRFRAPTFAHDGNYVFYVLRGANAAMGDLYRVPALGGTARKILSGVSSPVALAPDDGRIAFVRELQDDGASSLLMANVDGTNERELIRRRFPDTFSVDGAAWSPDGQVIACPITNFAVGVNQQVLTVRVGDGRTNALPAQPWPSIGRVTWAADGRGLLMSARAPRDLARQIWRLSYPGGQARRITNDLSDYRGITLSADGATAVAVQINQVSDLWVTPIGAAPQPQQITFSSGSNDGVQGLAWTPAGRIVYTSNASGQPDLWQVNTDGLQAQPLTADASNDSFPSASTDGRYIVFNSDRSGTTGVWRMDSDGGNLRQLTTGQLDLDPRCVPGSDGVVFSSIKSGKRILWKVALSGGEPEPLLEHLSEYPLVSPDGKLIACAYRDEQTGSSNRIAVLPITGGAPLKTLPVLMSPWRLARWAPDSQALTYIETRNGVSNIWRQPLDERAPKKQLTDFRSGRIFAFDWSADGKQFVCARGLETREIVLISNFR